MPLSNILGDILAKFFVFLYLHCPSKLIKLPYYVGKKQLWGKADGLLIPFGCCEASLSLSVFSFVQ